MGLSPLLFVNPKNEEESLGDDIDIEFLCPVCKDVLDDPVKLKGCDHAVCCRACVKGWQQNSRTNNYLCPVANCGRRAFIGAIKNQKPNGLFMSLLNKLKLRCPFPGAGVSVGDGLDGCKIVVSYGELDNHKKVCEFNPENFCKQNGCGAFLSQEVRQNESHNCLVYMNEKLKKAEEVLKKAREVIPKKDEELKSTKNQLAISQQLATLKLKREAKVDSNKGSVSVGELHPSKKARKPTFTVTCIKKWGIPDQVVQDDENLTTHIADILRARASKAKVGQDPGTWLQKAQHIISGRLPSSLGLASITWTREEPGSGTGARSVSETGPSTSSKIGNNNSVSDGDDDCGPACGMEFKVGKMHKIEILLNPLSPSVKSEKMEQGQHIE